MLDGRTAFVTGASQGIGREIAETLAREGANVVLAARSDGIYETADRVDDPERTLPVETDVTDESSVRESVAAAVEAFGGVDCLVNNAGIAGPTAPVEDVERADWDRTLAVNVTGAYLCAKHAAPHLRASDCGSVVNVSSISGKRPLPERTPYAASKMALVGLTRTLAFELGEDGVTVNAVSPGATRGPRIDAVVEAQAEAEGVSVEEARRRRFDEPAAIGRLVDPEDTAEMVAFLASEKARHVTAQDVSVDGGATWY
ncbi:MAG: SDR family NAD(P)-dependent oxidoreductase [Halobacteriaceae archaeon]